MQTSSQDIHALAQTLGSQFFKYESNHPGEVTPTQRETVESFIQNGAPSFSEHSSQSGEIFGILTQMMDTFKADLADSEAEKASGKANFDEQNALLKEMQATTAKQQKTSNSKMGAAAANLEAAKAAKASAEEQKERQETLLADTTEACAASKKEYEARVSGRNEELDAVAKALEFLNSDEAFAMFGQTQMSVPKPSFIQTKSTKSVKSTLVLAQAIRAGVFDKVLHAIDDLIAGIEEDKKNDAAKKDECAASIHEKKSKLAENKNSIEKTTTFIDGLTLEIEETEKLIESLTEDIARLNQDQTDANVNRADENAEFQKTVADQQASIKILTQALDVLRNVYATKSFVQTAQAPGQFQDQGQNSGGMKVLNMIQKIIDETQTAQNVAQTDENNAHARYEKFSKENNAAIEAAETARATATDEAGKKKETKAEKEAELDKLQVQNENMTQGLAAFEEKCAFLLSDNYNVRLAHQDEEIGALNDAKAFLNGMTAQ